MQRRKARRVFILSLIVFMALLCAGNLCGQHFRETEETQEKTVVMMDYIRGVYILREVDG